MERVIQSVLSDDHVLIKGKGDDPFVRNIFQAGLVQDNIRNSERIVTSITIPWGGYDAEVCTKCPRPSTRVICVWA